MPATKEQVRDLFLQHEGETVLREVRGQGKRIARRVDLDNPILAADFLCSGAENLEIHGNAVTAIRSELNVTYFL